MIIWKSMRRARRQFGCSKALCQKVMSPQPQEQHIEYRNSSIYGKVNAAVYNIRELVVHVEILQHTVFLLWLGIAVFY